ncbi:MAG TPA: hypothetical protein VF525_06185 [Pyrinomonadaceae bacterium]|jgi:hypothetical protein
MEQPKLFGQQASSGTVAGEQLVLYALGEFQARGKTLAARELPLDRLRGALRRAAEAFGVVELSDEDAVAAFSTLGAHVQRVPPFVAKHPFRVTVPLKVAERAREFYQRQQDRQATDAG